MFRKPVVLSLACIALSLIGCGGGSSSKSSGGSSASISVAVSAAASVVDATDSVSLTARLSNDATGAGVTWTVKGLGSVAGAGTIATYTAPAASTSSITATITATSVADPSKSGSVTISVPAAPSVTTASMQAGAVGLPYAATLSGSGGIAPYHWTVDGGSLPAGLALSDDGQLSGTPLASAAGTNSLYVRVADSGKANALTATRTLSFDVDAAPALQLPGTVPDANFGTAYSAALTASGGRGPLQYSLTSGSLPAGVTFSAGGLLAGTPTSSGVFQFTIRVADSFGDALTHDYSLHVAGSTLGITTPALPTAYVNTAYAPRTFSAIGGSGSGYKWSVADVATLPAGMNFSADGVLSGTPTAAGQFAFSVTVTDSLGSMARAQVSFNVAAGVSITASLNLPAGNVQAPYSVMLAATGGAGSPYLWSVNSGSALPAGLTLQNNGVISGTPTATGSFSFSLTVKDPVGNAATGVFQLSVGNNVVITSGPALSTTWVGATFLQTLRAVGGTGTGYAWSLAQGSSLPAGLALTAAGKLSGTPASAGSFTFGVTVTDSGQHTGTATLSLLVNPRLSITTASLPHAVVGTSYRQTLTATGATGSGYIWTVTSGNSSLTTLGLSVSTAGIVSGVPKASGTAAFSVSVTDPSLTYATANLSVLVDGPGASVSGNIGLMNNCGGSSLPEMQVSLDTSPVQTATTDPSGNYTFPSVPNGTYTLTPFIAGANAAFYPASLSGVVVNGAAVTAQTIQAAVGYTVSGTASNAGTHAGRIYIELASTCSASIRFGTSLPAPGRFDIRGVAPGSYTVRAWQDSLGYGEPSLVDAVSAPFALDVEGDTSSADVALSDPTVTLAGGPLLNSVSATDQGVILQFTAPTSSNSQGRTVEAAATYTVEWSTEADFETGVASVSLPAVGAGGPGVWVLNNGLPNLSGAFVNGTSYYFRARSETPLGHGPWMWFGDPNAPNAVTIGAPSAANLVTGTIQLPGTPSGPLYVGLFDKTSGAAYATWFPHPGATQPYSVQAPAGNYLFFAVLDRNADGVMDPGDLTLARDSVQIAGSSVQDATLADVRSTASVTTQHWIQTQQSGSDGVTTEGYGLNLTLAATDDLPVSVSLAGGPNLIHPTDLARCTTCNNVQFVLDASTAGVVPQSGDTYLFDVTYVDGSTEQVAGSVTGVLADVPANLAPAGGANPAGTSPTFSWTDPPGSATDRFSFTLQDNTGVTVWQLSGFDSSILTIPWAVDPTGTGTLPSVSSLTTGVTYTWQIQVQDADGNTARAQTFFLP